jgi:hypothetical protein
VLYALGMGAVVTVLTVHLHWAPSRQPETRSPSVPDGRAGHRR